MKRQIRFSLVLALVFLSFLFLVMESDPFVSGTKFTVDDDGGADYSKIQDAVDAAVDGDIIQVFDGFYYENIIVEDRLTITGSGIETTIINGGGKGDVVTLSGAGTVFSGFKVIRSGTDGSDASIRITENDIYVHDTLCEQSEIGIYVVFSGSPHQLSGIEIGENILTGNDVGISMSYCDDSLIRDNNCSDNVQIGIKLINSGYSEIERNICHGEDRGIYSVSSSFLTIGNNSLIDNGWSGIYLESTTDSLIINNTSSGNGDGITLKGSDGNEVRENDLTMNENGIQLLDSDSNTISNNIASQNSLRGLFLRGSQSNEVRVNHVTMNDEGIVFNGYLSVYSRDNNIRSNLIMDNVVLGMNASGNGGFFVDAEQNFWGHASGPYQDDDNPEGMGDDVTGSVDFDPWTHSPAGYTKVTAVIDMLIPRTTLLGEEITFEGSIVEDREMETYVWSSSIDGLLNNGTATGIARSNLTAGNHTITFIGIDFRGIPSAPASQYVIVHSAPTAQIVSIQPTSPILEGQSITFTASGTDDGVISRYAWRVHTGLELYNGTDSETMISGLLNGTLTFFLKVMDDNGIWSPEVNTTLTINGKPRGTIISISPNPALIDTDVTFTATASDDGTIVEYIWTDGNGTLLFNGTSATFSRSDIPLGVHEVRLQVKDDLGALSDVDTTTIQITLQITENKIPRVVITGPAGGGVVDGKFKVKGTASDEDGTVERVEISIDGGGWQVAQGTEDWSKVLEGEDVGLGEHTITIRSYDGTDYSNVASVTFTIVEEEENGGGGLIPGFGMIPMLVGAMVASILFFRRHQ